MSTSNPLFISTDDLSTSSIPGSKGLSITGAQGLIDDLSEDLSSPSMPALEQAPPLPTSMPPPLPVQSIGVIPTNPCPNQTSPYSWGAWIQDIKLLNNQLKEIKQTLDQSGKTPLQLFQETIAVRSTLNITTTNPLLETHYREYKKPHLTDSGTNLRIPTQLIVPAKALGFKINHQVMCRVDSSDSVQRGYELFPRSSICKTPLRMSNSIGLIDWEYRGPIIATVDNHSDRDYIIDDGTELFQLVCFDRSAMVVKVVSSLDTTERGSGGFGSTTLPTVASV